MLCFACPALVMLCLSPGNKLPGYPRRCPAGHCCLSSFHRRLVHHTVTRITSFRCISHLLLLTEVHKNRFYVPYVNMSFPLLACQGDVWKTSFYNSRGHLCLRKRISSSFAVWKTGTWQFRVFADAFLFWFLSPDGLKTAGYYIAFRHWSFRPIL